MSSKYKGSRRRFLGFLYRYTASVLTLGILPMCRLSGNAGSGFKEHGTPPVEPSYLKLHRTGELKQRGEELYAILSDCRLCPRECRVDRLHGEKGVCQSSRHLEISSYHPHFGEEKPLVGEGGSGTIFMTNCSLRCVFCINWEISQGGMGTRSTLKEMADMMLRLQKAGCPNINFVTPTHYAPHIVQALDIAASKGLCIPLVYNTHGYERVEILRQLDGIVDIYLPDFKYSDPAKAAKFSSEAEDYPGFAQKALLEMHRQVGVAHPAEDGIMYRGLMIRHLVMPNNAVGSKDVMEWIAGNLPKDTFVNIMSQYRPVYKAKDYPEIARRITNSEYREVVDRAIELGLTNVAIQGTSFMT